MFHFSTLPLSDLCFSRGSEGSTQQASASAPDVGEDLSIFWVQLFCLRCCCCWPGGGWGRRGSVAWALSSLARRSALSSCAGERRAMKEAVNGWMDAEQQLAGSPSLNSTAEASSKHSSRRRKQFDLSGSMQLSMLLDWRVWNMNVRGRPDLFMEQI